jgi:predicted DNA-binding ArsR family transcriptional regulator
MVSGFHHIQFDLYLTLNNEVHLAYVSFGSDFQIAKLDKIRDKMKNGQSTLSNIRITSWVL